MVVRGQTASATASTVVDLSQGDENTKRRFNYQRRNRGGIL